MATVRVFLPTYRRPHLLPRAIASLRAQTFSDWICDVHNDAPEDDAPRKLLVRMQDARFSLIQHERNLGGTATFNRFFKAVREPFYAMLEDDNWWEPDFLSGMLAAATAHQEITFFWANMRLWQEQPDGSFNETGRCVWPLEKAPYRKISWGQPSQFCGALHSHGAALVRSRLGTTLLLLRCRLQQWSLSVNARSPIRCFWSRPRWQTSQSRSTPHDLKMQVSGPRCKRRWPRRSLSTQATTLPDWGKYGRRPALSGRQEPQRFCWPGWLSRPAVPSCATQRR